MAWFLALDWPNSAGSSLQSSWEINVSGRTSAASRFSRFGRPRHGGGRDACGRRWREAHPQRGPLQSLSILLHDQHDTRCKSSWRWTPEPDPARLCRLQRSAPPPPRPIGPAPEQQAVAGCREDRICGRGTAACLQGQLLCRLTSTVTGWHATVAPHPSPLQAQLQPPVVPCTCGCECRRRCRLMDHTAAVLGRLLSRLPREPGCIIPASVPDSVRRTGTPGIPHSSPQKTCRLPPTSSRRRGYTCAGGIKRWGAGWPSQKNRLHAASWRVSVGGGPRAGSGVPEGLTSRPEVLPHAHKR